MIKVNNLTINYGGRDLFSPINLHINTGETVVLMGASGIGKTSILNAVANNIKYVGNISSDKNFTVFQDSHQLFPWFTIRKNLDLVCRKNYIDCVRDWQLVELLDSKPNTVSGGQRQRFTLIRAMYSGSDNLLCDEPLSGLDSMTRYFVLKDMKSKIVELKLCCLWISHDLNEAKYIGDKILLLTSNGLENISKDISEDEFIKKLSN
jgi:NitT/TauT family transport system ATP-binding protein